MRLNCGPVAVVERGGDRWRPERCRRAKIQTPCRGYGSARIVTVTESAMLRRNWRASVDKSPVRLLQLSLRGHRRACAGAPYLLILCSRSFAMSLRWVATSLTTNTIAVDLLFFFYLAFAGAR